MIPFKSGIILKVNQTLDSYSGEMCKLLTIRSPGSLNANPTDLGNHVYMQILDRVDFK
jgi:hypothetical protein